MAFRFWLSAFLNARVEVICRKKWVELWLPDSQINRFEITIRYTWITNRFSCRTQFANFVNFYWKKRDLFTICDFQQNDTNQFKFSLADKGIKFVNHNSRIVLTLTQWYKLGSLNAVNDINIFPVYLKLWCFFLALSKFFQNSSFYPILF